MAGFEEFGRDPDPPRWLKPAIWLSIPVAAFAFYMTVASVLDVVGRRGVPGPGTGPIPQAATISLPPRAVPRPGREAAAPPAAEPLPPAAELPDTVPARVGAEAAAEAARREVPSGAGHGRPDLAGEDAPGPAAAEAGPPPPAAAAPAASGPPSPVVPLLPPPRVVAALPHAVVPPPLSEPPPTSPGSVPAAAPAVRPVPAGPRGSSRAADPRCAALVARFQLGELPSDAERSLLRSACAPGR